MSGRSEAARITAEERAAIVAAVKSLDPQARVWLFGSRADVARRGGDIDIAVLSRRIGRLDRMRIRGAICDAVGEQKIDIVVSDTGRDAFFRQATAKGVAIDE